MPRGSFTVGEAVRDCRTLAFLAKKRPFFSVFDHQNYLVKKQNDLYAILERRVFKVRHAPVAGQTQHCRSSTAHRAVATRPISLEIRALIARDRSHPRQQPRVSYLFSEVVDLKPTSGEERSRFREELVPLLGNPKGILPSSPGLPQMRLPWVNRPTNPTTPSGLRPSSRTLIPNLGRALHHFVFSMDQRDHF